MTSPTDAPTSQTSGIAADLEHLVESAQVFDIRIVRSSTELSDPNIEGELNARTEPEMSWGQDSENSFLQYQMSYRLTISHGDTTVFLASATIVITFNYTGSSLDGALAEQFGNNTVAVMAHPYAREMFQRMTLQAGLPAFVLPLIKRIPKVAPDTIVEASD